MGRDNNWPSVPGWIWEIDFEAGKAVTKRQNASQNTSTAEQIDSDPSLLVEGPIMNLGDMDLDIIRRLLEKRNTHADQVRSNLRRSVSGEFPIDELYDMVRQLGGADKDVRDWFNAMADKYKWPRSWDNSWIYRVDTSEQKVYLTRRGNLG